jgi:hypothetical protein
MRTPNYDFDLDLPIAKKTEKQVAQFLVDNAGMTFLGECDNNAYDLQMQSNDGRIVTIEVKEDFTCQRTGNVGVEYECRGKPSGISVSKADLYLYKVHQPNLRKGLYVISTKKLKKMIDDGLYHRVVNGGDPGSNSMNYLFTLEVIQDNFKRIGFVE